MSAAGGGGHRGGGCGGGESQTHIRCKHLLKTYAGRYVFLVRSCACYRPHTQTWERGADSDGVSIEQVHRTGASHVSFDACMMRNGKPAVALEVWHTHATGPEKIAQTREAGIALAEFKSEDILRMEAVLADSTATYELSNTQVEYVTCGECLQREAREAAQMLQRMQARMAAQREAEERTRTMAEQIRQQTARRAEICHLEGETSQMARQQEARRLKSRSWSDLRDDGCRLAASWKASSVVNAACVQTKYEKDFRKCVGCVRWRAPVAMSNIARTKFTEKQLATHCPWHRENGRDWPAHVPMCDSCIVSCVRCGDEYPLALALIYGLCYDCHKCCAHNESPTF